MTFWRSTNRFSPLVRINIGIDKCFTIQEKQDAIEGLIRWQNGTDGLVLFHIGNMSMNKLVMNKDDGYTNYAINIVKSYSTDKAIQKQVEKFGHTLNGLASWHKDTTLAFVVVDKIKTRKEFIGLVMHEVGHLLGLSHQPSGTVMCRYSGRPTRVTAADRYQLISSWRKWLGL